jgi:hypothetical protein
MTATITYTEMLTPRTTCTDRRRKRPTQAPNWADLPLVGASLGG